MTPLSAAQMSEVRRGLDDDGYHIIPGVVSKDLLNSFNQQILRAYDEADRFKGGGSLSGHLNCLPGESARPIYEQIESQGVLDAIYTACPELPRSLRVTMNFNLPGSVAQHYHMDGVYTQDYVICNVAVVDTSVENGAIDVLPSTHQEFYPFWKYALQRKYRLTTRLPLTQGDVLLRRSTLWHRGMPNISAGPRAMFSLAVGEQYVDGSDPFLANGGDIKFYPNWYSTTPTGALRERMEVALPVTRSIVRFARSLVGNRGYSSY
jgi:ectoine hydroxylase-related dioxygenase (phytanoyl-CoA dioxygenase family)